MLTSYSQPSSLSEHLCGRRQLGDVVNVGDFSAPYHLSEDHMRQSFLSLLFFQHLTLLFLCHFSPWFKSYSHCSHSQWNPTGFFFFSPWFSLLFDFIYSLSIEGSSHILMSSLTGCLLRMLFPCGTLRGGHSVSLIWDSVSARLIIHMYILGITSPPSWLNLSLDVYANRLGVSTVDTLPYHCLP